MLSPRWRKVSRDAWLNKARTALVIAALAVGLAGSGALLDAWALVRRVTAETYVASHPVSATLRLDRIDAGLLERVRAMPGIAAVRARRAVFASAASSTGESVALLFALSDFEARDIAVVSSELGPWPPRDGEIVIEKSSLEFSGARVGEPMTLRIAGGSPHALPVSGIAHDVGLAPGWMDHVVYGFVTPATLEQLGAPSSLDELQLVVRDATASRDAVRAIADDVKRSLEHEGRQVLSVNVPVPMEHPHAAQMDSLLLTQGAFALLTLLVCSFLIVNLVAAMLASQLREIGVMKALGARSGQLAAMYLAFVAAIGILASSIALPVALVAGRRYGALKADLLNFPIDGFAIPWWAIALQLVVGAAVPIAAAAIGVARACRMPVAEALCDPGIATANEDYRVRRRIHVPFLGRPLMLSIGNAFRRRQRMVLTLLALTLGGAVFVGADSLRESVRDSVDLMVASQRYDLVLKMAEPQPAEKLEQAVIRASGVERVEAWTGASATPVESDGTLGNAFTIFGLPADSKMVVPRMISGRWLDAVEGRSLIVNRALAKDDPRMTAGADVTLVIGGKPAPWKIAGIADVGAQPLAYALRAAVGDARGDARALVAAVVLSPTADNGALTAVLRLREALDHAGMRVTTSVLTSENRRAIEDHLFLVVQFLGAMGWVMIAVGGMGLASTMGIAVLERTREIGVMRAIGARHSTIAVIVQTEGLVIALLSWLFALLLSIPMSVALGRAFGAIMFPVPERYLPTLSGSLGWLAVAVAVSIAACAWPAMRATRIPTAAALSHP